MTFHIEPVVHIPELDDLFERIEAMHAETMQALSDLFGMATLNVQGTARILEGEAAMADQLSDIQAKAADLGIDVQAIADATDQLQDQVSDLGAQLDDAGVDPAARDAILASLTDYQTTIRTALDPNVPVPPPEEPPVEEPPPV